jgi:hypothetical protein
MKLLCVFLLSLAAFAQTASNRVPGSVTSVNAGANQVAIKTSSGDFTFTTSDRTQILRAPAGVTDPKQWPKMTLGEVAVGDEVVAYYRGALDQKPLVATSIVVRTKADLGAIAQKQSDDWKKRGSTGIVSAVDPGAKTVTVKAGRRTLTVQASDKTVVRRYPPDSAKPADAKTATLAEIQPGDQVNVLGNRSEDGATVTAEQIYAGSFRQFAVTINSIDAATGAMTVTDLATKKPLTIRVTSETTMKKLPEQMAQMLARRYQGGGRGADAAGRGAEGAGRGPDGGGRGDVGQMLERLPVIQLSDLKAKDALMLSTTAGSDPSKVTAIMLLAGVEPVLTAAPTATRDIMSGWNLEGGGEGQ